MRPIANLGLFSNELGTHLHSGPRRSFLKAASTAAAWSVLARTGLVSVPAFAQAGGLAKGKAVVKALVEQAKKEPNEVNGHLTLAFLPLAKKANQLFNAYFGLNKTIHMIEGVDNTFTAKMIQTLKMGGTPDLIFYATNGSDMPMFVQGGYAKFIKNWKDILTAINPRIAAGAFGPNDVSPSAYGGYGFAYSNRLKGVGYNTSVPLKDLPHTYAEMADPKYAGHYAIEPWTSHWEAFGYEYYPDRLDEFLKIMNAIGKNTYVVSRSHQLVPRMALGEINFMTLNAEVVAKFVADNPGAPLDYYFMDDMTLVETTLMFIPPKSPAPATAALWVLYFSHPDVQALRGPDAPNIMYGELKTDVAMRNRLKGKHVWDWTMNDSTTKYWKWLNSKEGRSFRTKIRQAVRQRK